MDSGQAFKKNKRFTHTFSETWILCQVSENPDSDCGSAPITVSEPQCFDLWIGDTSYLPLHRIGPGEREGRRERKREIINSIHSVLAFRLVKLIRSSWRNKWTFWQYFYYFFFSRHSVAIAYWWRNWGRAECLLLPHIWHRSQGFLTSYVASFALIHCQLPTVPVTSHRCLKKKLRW